MKGIVRGGEMGTDRSGPRQQVLLSESNPESAHYFPSSLPGSETERGRENEFGETGERQRAKATS